jgi:hypothetical protein
MKPTIRGGVRYRPAKCPSIHSDEDAFCRKGFWEVLKESLKKDEKLGRVGVKELSALS